MLGKNIGKDVARILLRSRQQEDAIQQLTAWPGEDGLRDLARAVMVGSPFVFIRGRRFAIRYETRFSNQKDTVFVESMDGVQTCQYFSRDKLKEYEN